jgi:hypothetical protein
MYSNKMHFVLMSLLITSAGQSLLGMDKDNDNTAPNNLTRDETFVRNLNGMVSGQTSSLGIRGNSTLQDQQHGTEMPNKELRSSQPPKASQQSFIEKMVAGAVGGFVSEYIYMKCIKDYMPINLLRQGHFTAMRGYIKILKNKTGLDQGEQKTDTLILSENDLNTFDKEINELVELNKRGVADYRNRLDKMPSYTKLARHEYGFMIERLIASNVLSVVYNIMLPQYKTEWNKGKKDWLSLFENPFDALSQETVTSSLAILWNVTRDPKTWNRETEEFAQELKRLRDRVATLRSVAQLKVQSVRAISQLEEKLQEFQNTVTSKISVQSTPAVAA